MQPTADAGRPETKRWPCLRTADRTIIHHSASLSLPFPLGLIIPPDCRDLSLPSRSLHHVRAQVRASFPIAPVSVSVRSSSASLILPGGMVASSFSPESAERGLSANDEVGKCRLRFPSHAPDRFYVLLLLRFPYALQAALS